MYSIEITEPARNDIIGAFNYISQTLYNENAAKNLLDEIEKKIKGLKDFPEMYPLVHDGFLSSEGIRTVRIKNYLLFYRVVREKVKIQRFLYGRRNWQDIIKTDL